MREGNNAQVTDDKRKIRLILWTVKGEEAKCSRTLSMMMKKRSL
jgi:hypothetical protein